MSWESLEYRRAEIAEPACLALCEAMAGVHLNGGVVFARLTPTDPDAFAIGVQEATSPTSAALLDWLANPTVREAVPDLQIPPAADVQHAPSLHATHALGMEAELTHRLLVGGAYQAWDGAVEAARQLAKDCVAAMLEDRLLEATVFLSRSAWTPWFRQVAWDLTFFVRDLEARMVWILALTDED